MKVYILIENPYEKESNPYVKTLIDGINNQYNDIEWGYGISIFWKDNIFDYDIIHIHWPNVFIWTNDMHIKNGIKTVEERILQIKKRGIKIISTCHNLKPHYSRDKREHELYDIVYKYSDCILHLGNYSLSLFKKIYPNTDNRLLLHHIYDSLFNNLPSFNISVKALKLSEKNKYILCFGAFRDNQERNLIIKLAQYLKNKKVSILAPSFMSVPKRRNLFYVIKPYLKYLYYKYKYPQIITTKYYVSDELLTYYYGASSISLIQRLDILNSGNVPLGFLMKNIVVGPNVGNVGTWLNETNNPTFDPNRIETLFSAIDIALKDENCGINNYNYAMNNLKVSIISSKLYNIYKYYSIK